MNFLFIISIVLNSQAMIHFPALPQPSQIVRNTLWDQLLKNYVSSNGTVNYKEFKIERSKLNTYLNQVSKDPPSDQCPKNQEIAYWINVYNAYTIDLILQHYPVKSIRDINNGKPWDLEFITIGGKKYSLNQIENDILRKKFSDPRIHFAINCASKSCPKLMNAAFTKEQLDVQLNTLAKAFINDPEKNKISANKAEVSEIFNWYKDDFTKSGSLIDFLNKYSDNKLSPGAPISYLAYDWSLNE